MRNKKKRVLLIALSLMLIFALVACGGTDVPVDVEEDPPVDDYRAMSIIKDVLNVEKNSLYMSFTTEFENDLMDVKLYIKDGNTRMDTSDPEYGSMSLISNESGDYVIMHDAKSYYKSPNMEDVDDIDFLYSEEDFDNYEVTTGQEEIKGILYDFEKLVEVDDDGKEDITIFYFVLGTDQWAALKTEDTMMYINEISRDVDDNIFKIPSGYQEIEI